MSKKVSITKAFERAAKSIPRPPTVMPEAVGELVHTLLNVTIHELVFVAHHASDHQVEEAAQGLMTAQANLDRVAELLALYDPSNKA